MAPCARCCYIGARCVTGATGRPGRPPKQRLAGGGSAPVGTAANRVDVSLPEPHRTSTLRDMDSVEFQRPTLGYGQHGNVASYSAVPESALNPHSPRDPVSDEPQPDVDMSAFFNSASLDRSLASGDDVLALADQLSSPAQLQGLLGAGDDELNAMLHMNGDSSTAPNIDLDLLHGEYVLPSTPLPQCFSAARSLVKFREEIDLRITTVDTYYSNPSQVVQRCKDGGHDVENPAALLLTCSKEFTDIIQSLTPVAPWHPQTEDTPSTEIALLALSSYLSLMRLFDSLFDRIYKHLCQVPLESHESLKVKSVLRIGGVSSLQDMSLKAYAVSILDAIQGQVQTLELCMGIPAEYCLSGEAPASSAAAVPGIFSRADRARLFWAVMAQEDIKSRRGSKSYVESIRANIKESMVFLDK